MVAGPLSLSVIKCVYSHSPVNKAIRTSLTCDSWKQWYSKYSEQRCKSLRSLMRDILAIARIRPRRKLLPLSLSSATQFTFLQAARNNETSAMAYNFHQNGLFGKMPWFFTNLVLKYSPVKTHTQDTTQRKILSRIEKVQSTCDGRHRSYQNPYNNQQSFKVAIFFVTQDINLVRQQRALLAKTRCYSEKAVINENGAFSQSIMLLSIYFLSLDKFCSSQEGEQRDLQNILLKK